MVHRQARRPTRTFAVAAAGRLRLRVVVAAELVVAAAEPVVKAAELAALAGRILEERPDAVVMGLPLLTDGTESMTTRQVRNVTERLKRRVPLPFYFMSELLSSEAAERELREVGRTGRRCKAVLDQQAAVRILESFLSLSPDQRRPA